MVVLIAVLGREDVWLLITGVVFMLLISMIKAFGSGLWKSLKNYNVLFIDLEKESIIAYSTYLGFRLNSLKLEYRQEKKFRFWEEDRDGEIKNYVLEYGNAGLYDVLIKLRYESNKIELEQALKRMQENINKETSTSEGSEME